MTRVAERTLAVLGATGRTGREVVAQALARGWRVRALVRDAAKAPGAWHGIVLVQGDATDPAAVREAVRGATAVVGALGHAAGKRRSPPDLLARAAQNVVAAMRAEGARRLVLVTARGVACPKDRPRLADRFARALRRRSQRRILADAARARDVVAQSGLDWTLVRGARVVESPAKGAVRVGYVGVGTGRAVTRADLARFVLDEVDAREHVHDMPLVSN